MADTKKYRVVRDLKIVTTVPAGSEIDLTEADANAYLQNGDINPVEDASASDAGSSEPPTPPADAAPAADEAAGAPAGNGE